MIRVIKVKKDAGGVGARAKLMSADGTGFGALLCGKKRYRLLRNQRRYAWEKKHITEFVNDIESIYKKTGGGARQHFFGSMVFAKKGRFLTVIDGQQRMATAGVFIGVLRDMLIDEGRLAKARNVQKRLRVKSLANTHVARIELGKANDEFYSKYVIQERSAKEKVGDLMNEYTDKKKPNYWLAYAYCEFYTKIKSWLRLKIRQPYSRLLSIVLSVFTVIRIVLATHEYAFRIFETLNNRGEKLKQSDLIKSYIIEYCDRQKQDCINNDWECMIKELRGKKLDDYLRYFWIANHKHVSKQDLFEGVTKYIKSRNTKAKIEKYVQDLLEQAKIFNALHNPKNNIKMWRNDGKLIQDLSDLNALDAQLVKIVLLIAKSRSVNKKDYRRLAHMLICFFFRSRTICGVHATDIELAMGKIASELRGSKKVNFKKIKRLLKDDKVYPTNEEFHDAFVNKRLQPKIQHYVMLQLELKTSPKTDVRPIEQITVEHIVPKVPADNWKQVRGSDHKRLLNTVGNLALLGPNDNPAAGNKSWRRKREIYKKSGITITNSLAKKTKWGKNEVEARTAEFAKLALKIWAV